MAVEADLAAAPARRGRRLRHALGTPGLLGLPIGWLTCFFLVPIGIVVAYSLGPSLALSPHPVTLKTWHDFLHSSTYLRLFWSSLELSLIVSVMVVALAYPLAYYLALSGTKRKYVLLLLLIAPFITSYLLRVLAWKIILGNNGPVDSFLSWVGLHPLSLIYTRFAVILVLGYIWLPFVALPIFVTLESLDQGLLEAASDLYASRLQAFRRVTLPLSLPGVVAAFLFVFIPTLGEFVTPSLVGGSSSSSGYMYGSAIQDLFEHGFPDWETGAVLSIFLLGVVGVLSIVFARFLQPRQVAAD